MNKEKMTYEQAKEIVEFAQGRVDYYSDKLNAYPKGAMGLVPEHIRLSDEYRQLSRTFDDAFKTLQDVNKWFLKNYKKEYLKEREEKRRAKMNR